MHVRQTISLYLPQPFFPWLSINQSNKQTISQSVLLRAEQHNQNTVNRTNVKGSQHIYKIKQKLKNVGKNTKSQSSGWNI